MIHRVSPPIISCDAQNIVPLHSLIVCIDDSGVQKLSGALCLSYNQPLENVITPVKFQWEIAQNVKIPLFILALSPYWGQQSKIPLLQVVSSILRSKILNLDPAHSPCCALENSSKSCSDPLDLTLIKLIIGARSNRIWKSLNAVVRGCLWEHTKNISRLRSSTILISVSGSERHGLS